MRRDFEKPYTNYPALALIYQKALENGFDETQAVEWTERAYCFTERTLENRERHGNWTGGGLLKLRNFEGKEYLSIDEWIKDVDNYLKTLPKTMFSLAYRVLANRINHPLLDDERMAIRKLYPEELNGETVHHTFDDWKNHRIPFKVRGSGKSAVFNRNTLKMDWDIISESEYAKIIKARKGIANKYVEYYLSSLKIRIDNRLNGALMPEEIIQDELDQIKDRLISDVRNQAKYIFQDKEGQYHFWRSLKPYYDRVIRYGKGEVHDYFSNTHLDKHPKDFIVNEGLALAIYKYQQYLKNLLKANEEQTEQGKLTEDEQIHIIDSVKRIREVWKEESVQNKIKAYKGHIKGALTQKPESSNRDYFIELLKKEIAILDGSFDEKYLNDLLSRETKSNESELSPEKLKQNAKLIFSSKEIIDKLFNCLKEYFPGREEELLTVLNGEVLKDKLLFPSNQNKIVEVFRRLKYNGFVISNTTKLKEWLCQTFSYTYTKGKKNEVRPLNPSTVYELLSKGNSEPSSKKLRICVDDDWIPWKSQSQIQNEKE